MRLERHIDQKLEGHFNRYRQILTLLGPRQVGKTTILKRLFPDAEYLLLDNRSILDSIEAYDISVYKRLWEKNKTVILDELHLVSEPGRAAKIIYDMMPDVRLIITGSSSLDIKNRIGESLAGRKITYKMFPLTFSEYLYQTEIEKELDEKISSNIIKNNLEKKYHLFDLQSTLSNSLLWGLYPELVKLSQNKGYLTELAESVIFKDLLELHLIKDKRLALDLLKLLAYQIGNLISYNELAVRLSASTKTIKRYIRIFEDSFIIFRLYPFSNQKRNEISKSSKIYFYDTGLRNALIDNFDSLTVRNDRGALFENFIISEIYKAKEYGFHEYNLNYWRLKTGSEVDLVLNKGDDIVACEIKFAKGKVSKAFMDKYPQAKSRVITAENFY